MWSISDVLEGKIKVELAGFSLCRNL